MNSRSPKFSPFTIATTLPKNSKCQKGPISAAFRASITLSAAGYLSHCGDKRLGRCKPLLPAHPIDRRTKQIQQNVHFRTLCRTDQINHCSGRQKEELSQFLGRAVLGRCTVTAMPSADAESHLFTSAQNCVLKKAPVLHGLQGSQCLEAGLQLQYIFEFLDGANTLIGMAGIADALHLRGCCVGTGKGT